MVKEISGCGGVTAYDLKNPKPKPSLHRIGFVVVRSRALGRGRGCYIGSCEDCYKIPNNRDWGLRGILQL